jgi:outer membrane lipoprotein-sorting protein
LRIKEKIMLRLRVLAFTGCALVLGSLFVRAQETDLKEMLRKSIEAHGGEKNFAKYKAVSTKFKGTLQLQGAALDITGETSLQRPDKVKNVLTLDLNGKKIEIVTVYNGKKLWVSTMGQTKEIDDEKILNAAREEMQTEGAASFSDYLKPPYELSAIGDVKVKGKDAIGIRISKKGQKDLSVFLDKKNYLVVKTEMRTIDSTTGAEITQEKFIVGYQDKGGLKIAKRVEVQKDGKAFMDVEIIDAQAVEKFDDSTFAKP